MNLFSGLISIAGLATLIYGEQCPWSDWGNTTRCYWSEFQCVSHVTRTCACDYCGPDSDSRQPGGTAQCNVTACSHVSALGDWSEWGEWAAVCPSNRKRARACHLQADYDNAVTYQQFSCSSDTLYEIQEDKKRTRHCYIKYVLGGLFFCLAAGCLFFIYFGNVTALPCRRKVAGNPTARHQSGANCVYYNAHNCSANLSSSCEVSHDSSASIPTYEEAVKDSTYLQPPSYDQFMSSTITDLPEKN